MDLESKTKYTSSIKIAQQQKLPIVKLKKLSSITNFIQNKQPCPLKNTKQKNFVLTQKKKNSVAK